MKFRKLETIVKHLRQSVYTRANLYSSATKLLKLVHTPLNESFLKTLVVNLSFFFKILDI